MSKPRILLYDLETAPIVGYTWGIWETNVIKVIRDRHILCFAYKWLDEKTVHTVALPDFELYKKEPYNDREVVKALHKVFDEADIVIAHNGDRFDQKISNAMFIKHGLNPPSPYRQVDTLKVAKAQFKFTSSRLNDLGVFLGLGEKEKTGGFDTWEGCINGDPKAWKTMLKYNKRDVDLLEKVYLKLRPWATNHPGINIMSGELKACPKCGVSGRLQMRGQVYNKVTVVQRYQCQACGGWCRSRINERVPVTYTN